VKMGHVLVPSDSVPQGFERRVDNLPAAVIVHVAERRSPLVREAPLNQHHR
jgi:hypothetical protein